MDLPSDEQIIDSAAGRYAADKGNIWFKQDVDIDKSSIDKASNMIYLRDRMNNELAVFYLDSGRVLSEDEWNNLKANYGQKHAAKKEHDRILKERNEAMQELDRIRVKVDSDKLEFDRILKERNEAMQELDRIRIKVDSDKLEFDRILKERNEAMLAIDRFRIKGDSDKLEFDRILKVNQAIAKRYHQLVFIEVPHSSITQEESTGLMKILGGRLRNKSDSVRTTVYQEFLTDGIAITMVQIPSGSFQMGSPATEAERESNEGPQHEVQLQSFFLGQTQVTQAQWQEVANWPPVDLKLNPNPALYQGANRPVETVSWEEAMEFCRRLSKRTMLPYTLPSEAQWEYSCRAGNPSPFAFGHTLRPDLANYNGNFTYGSGPKGEFREKTTEVGSFAANAWGLHDMHGNVWEWCLDSWHETYKGAPPDGSAWTTDGGANRLLRGGSWGSNPRNCRSADRLKRLLDTRDSAFGFRLCLFPPGFIS
jgi:formylglycine-generating enzyme required for sulfatase activity